MTINGVILHFFSRAVSNTLVRNYGTSQHREKVIFQQGNYFKKNLGTDFFELVYRRPFWINLNYFFEIFTYQKMEKKNHLSAVGRKGARGKKDGKLMRICANATASGQRFFSQ